MGGRSKVDEYMLSDSWKWIAQLSDKRLNDYGKYSEIETRNHTRAGLSDGDSAVVRGKGHASAADLNFALAKYYEHKFGHAPDWAAWNRVKTPV